MWVSPIGFCFWMGASMKKRNSISGQFAARLNEMLESPAFRVLSLSAHRMLARIEVELGRHGGNDNYSLPITYEDFMDYGIDRGSIAPAERELKALGFIRIVHGRAGNADNRRANLYGMTFVHARDSRQNPPTHEWRAFRTIEEAKKVAQEARAAADEAAVARGKKYNPRRANFKKIGGNIKIAYSDWPDDDVDPAAARAVS